MNRIKWTLLTAALMAGLLPSQAQMHRASPHETVSAVIDGNRVTVVYGRPLTKDRKIWGGLVPYDKVWRLGADEATLLITQKPLVFGETTVPAGAYSLYMLPAESGDSKLIINKAIGQWGTQYSESDDLARVNLKKEDSDKSPDQLSISVAKNSSGGGVIRITWEKTEFSATFTVQK